MNRYLTAWSAPSSISPNNYAAGFVMGVDIFDAICTSPLDSLTFYCLLKMNGMIVIVVIRSQEALKTFYGHKATLGTDIGVVAGPVGVVFLLPLLSLSFYISKHVFWHESKVY